MADTRKASPVPSKSSVLEDIKQLQGRVIERIRVLEPYAQELDELRAQAKLMGIDPDTAKSKPAGQAEQPARRPRRKAASTKRRRAKATPASTRAEQVMAMVVESPGVTVPEIGKRLGTDSTGLYRHVRALEEAGRLRKDGRQLLPVKDAEAAPEATDDAPSEA